MGFYSERILPFLLNGAMKQPEMLRLRNRIIPQASERILEIGIGSGLNLPLYAADAQSIHGVEPSAALRKMAERAAGEIDVPLDLHDAGAEDLPFEDASFDTIISTWTMCTIPELARALGEMRRVLKPGGQFLFVEHGLAPESRVQAWQRRINPVWNCIGGGCNLNRHIADQVEAGGFALDRLETDYLVRGPKWATYTYLGAARPA